MSRAEARVQFRIWDDLDVLTLPAKALYLALLTDDSVNFAGVGRLAPELWARKVGLTRAQLVPVLDELVGADFVAVDDYTREVLVRTMIRNDGIADMPNLLKCALGEAQRVRSPKLARVLAAELRKLPPRPPDKITTKAGQERRYVYPDPHAVAAEIDPGPVPPPDEGGTQPLVGWDEANPSPEGFAGRVRAKGSPEGFGRRDAPKGWANGYQDGDGDGGAVSSPGSTSVGGLVFAAQQRDDALPEPSPTPPPEPEPAAPAVIVPAPPPPPARTAARGTRLPADFVVTQEMREWAVDECPDVDGRWETAQFRDYWLAASGQNATKRNWEAAWRTWMRRATTGPPGPRRSESREAATGRIFDQMLADDLNGSTPHLRSLGG